MKNKNFTHRLSALFLSLVMLLLTPCVAAADNTNGMPRFRDVLPGQWYYAAIEYVVEHGYFNGVSRDTFEPGAPTTRAMFVTALGRMAGVDPSAYSASGFLDVPEDSYYSGYVAWAVEIGIVQGLSTTLFGSNENITREQIAVFLYRYAKHIGLDTSVGQTAQPHTFDGEEVVSPWAMTAMVWANNRGIMKGTGNGLEPQAQATRAQVAQMLYSFAQLIGDN